MVKLMLITNDCGLARYAIESGVDRIFIDLEIHGKIERQGHLDTVISRHVVDDISKVRSVVPPSRELLVRLNPLFDGTQTEVEDSIKAGADLLMLPMFRHPDELKKFCEIVDGRVGIVPLVETPQAMVRLKEVVEVEGVTEVYIGLNDLHLGLGLDFMFEPLASGLVDWMCDIIGGAGKPFGFGGLARIKQGLVPGESVLAEHVRLGSQSVILSRTFMDGAKNLQDLKSKLDLPAEVRRVREYEMMLRSRATEEVLESTSSFDKRVRDVVESIRKTRGISSSPEIQVERHVQTIH